MTPETAATSAGGDTVAIVTADAAGNAVSLIQSLYYTYGAGIVAGDTGIVLQNRGAFFALDPRHVNALAPGKRTLHTLTPAMYLEGGRPRATLRDHGRRRTAPDGGRAAHPLPLPRARRAGQRRSAALAVRAHVGSGHARAQRRGSLSVRAGARAGRAADTT